MSVLHLLCTCKENLFRKGSLSIPNKKCLQCCKLFVIVLCLIFHYIFINMCIFPLLIINTREQKKYINIMNREYISFEQLLEFSFSKKRFNFIN